jgi:ribulose-phosphate 3-epimerase
VLEVDGGISAANAAEVAAAGATVLVIGSAMFNSKCSVAENMAKLREALTSGQRIHPSKMVKNFGKS